MAAPGKHHPMKAHHHSERDTEKAREKEMERVRQTQLSAVYTELELKYSDCCKKYEDALEINRRLLDHNSKLDADLQTKCAELHNLQQRLTIEQQQSQQLRADFASLAAALKVYKDREEEERRRRQLSVSVALYLDPIASSNGATLDTLTLELNRWGRDRYFTFEQVTHPRASDKLLLYVINSPTGRIEENYSVTQFREFANSGLKGALTVMRWGTNPDAFNTFPNSELHEFVYNGGGLLSCTMTNESLRKLEALLNRTYRS